MLYRLIGWLIVGALLGWIIGHFRYRRGSRWWYKEQWRLHDEEYRAVIKSAKRKGLLLLALLLLSACTFPAWRDQIYADLMAGRLQLDHAQVSPGGSPSSYLDFYDHSGRHLGYWIVREGYVDVYGADGSRVGYGRGR